MRKSNGAGGGKRRERVRTTALVSLCVLLNKDAAHAGHIFTQPYTNFELPKWA